MSNVYGDDKGLEFDHYDIDYYYNNDGDALLVEICLRWCNLTMQPAPKEKHVNPKVEPLPPVDMTCRITSA